MFRFDEVQNIALATHGIFTYKDVSAIGVRSPELSRWIRLGRIRKVGHGVYQLTNYPFEGIVTDMAAILAGIGKGAYLYGETALAFLNLCPTRSYVATIASQKRCRRKLEAGIKVVRAPSDAKIFYPSGIPCQTPRDAIISAARTMERERIEEAISSAEANGYFTEQESMELRKEIEGGYASEKRARA